MAKKKSDKESDSTKYEVKWTANHDESKTDCVCNSTWRCRCSVSLKPVEK